MLETLRASELAISTSSNESLVARLESVAPHGLERVTLVTGAQIRDLPKRLLYEGSTRYTMVDPEEIDTRVDVLAYKSGTQTEYRSVGAGWGDEIVAAHRTEYRTYRRYHGVKIVGVAILGGALSALGTSQLLIGVLVGAVLFAVGWSRTLEEEQAVPTVVLENAMPSRATERYAIETHTDNPRAEP